ncbi:MAG: glycosyltransferase family 2 protein [Eubacterium sp.]|jgi:putative flippase GtrA|nr:glycosyltransferase family 2 protein [Eubacterium sp.]
MKIIIPAYQPDKKLLLLIRDIKENSNYDIVIVDDGSSENFQPIFTKARNEGCTILTHTVNRGKGAALKTAFKYVLTGTSENEGVVCADCDGQHTWQDIRNIAENITWHSSSIIMGSREFTGKVPFRSLLGNTITRYVFSLASGCKISDTQTGLRGFSVRLLPWLTALKGDRYEYEMNQLLEAREQGFSLFSIPIETVYENNNKSSHFRPIRDSVKIYLPILKFSLSSVSCGLIDFLTLFILDWLTGNLLVSVVGARVISSFCNYMLNKNLVFKASKQQHGKAFVRYYGLVALILLCNYLLMDLFTNIVGMSLLVSKLLTELFLFFISYYAQKRYVFSQADIKR